MVFKTTRQRPVSHYDRLIIGGVKPTTDTYLLTTYDFLKADFFLQRREIVSSNVGAKGKVTTTEQNSFSTTKMLCISEGARRKLVFSSLTSEAPVILFNSAPAQCYLSDTEGTLQEAETVELGAVETSNHASHQKAHGEYCPAHMPIADGTN
jgi:4-deoxy-L-threo-5-hexosulose-uronate ketol-isomerase